MNNIKLGLTFRVLHWSIAAVVVLNAFILEEGDVFHRYLGYAAAGLVAYRFFIRKKRVVSHYNGKARPVYWLIWTSVLALALTGFLMGTDKFWGSQRLEDIHELISNFLLVLVALHLLGVFADAFLHKRKTWMVMITGDKH